VIGGVVKRAAELAKCANTLPAAYLCRMLKRAKPSTRRSLPKPLHLLPSLSAAGTLRWNVRPPDGDVMSTMDLLSCGPIRECGSLGEWRQMREAYLNGLWAAVYPSWPPLDLDDGAPELLIHADRLLEAGSITVWLGKGTDEQLFLVWLVRLFRYLDLDPGVLQVIQFDHDPVHAQQIWSVGSLNKERMMAHAPARALTPAEIRTLGAAWSAMTSDDPQAILAFTATGGEGLPFLRAALTSLRDRYPDRQSGLNRWESALLENVGAKRPRVMHALGDALVHRRDGPDQGDYHWLLGRFRRLADPSLRYPLATIIGESEGMTRDEIFLTEAGGEVLAGRSNFVHLNGIDDWVLGVHLESATGNVWYRTGDALSRDP
jgi:hypothetical protein